MMDKDAQSVTQTDDVREIVAALREGQQTNDQYGEVMIRAANMLEHLASQPTSAEDAVEAPIMLCEYCGRDENSAAASGHNFCLAPFDKQEHKFTKAHPYLKMYRDQPAGVVAASRPTPDTQTAAIGAEAMRGALERAQQIIGDGYVNWHEAARLALSQPVAAPQAGMAQEDRDEPGAIRARVRKDRTQAEMAGARADMLQTAAELRANSNGDPSAIQQAIYWERKAAALTPPQPEGGTVTLETEVERLRGIIRTYSNVHGVLTEDDRQRLKTALQPEKTK